MKKTILCMTILLMLLVVGCSTEHEDTQSPSAPVQTTKDTAAEKTATTQPVSMDNALFIGDSRTVGICEYAGLNEADFFATVGMSVYNVFDDTVSVPNVGKITLKELLSSKSYDKVYIMLGINEIGYKTDQTMENYAKLVETVKQTQPDAKIFVQANLHVTEELSQSDDVINNEAINCLNTSISKFADGRCVFYLDVNPLFDDESGCLDAKKTSDKVHIYAKHYIDWGKWIVEETTAKLSEADN